MCDRYWSTVAATGPDARALLLNGDDHETMDDALPTDQLPRRRRDRVVAAGHRGDVATVTDGLTDVDPGVRSAAIGAIVRLAITDSLPRSEATAAVVAGLDDDSLVVRRRSCEEAARLGATEGRDAGSDTAHLLDGLLRRLTDDDRVVEAAAFAMGELVLLVDGQRRRAVRALDSVATSHSDHMCRESAVAALGSIGDPAGLDAVLHGCHDRANVRRRAVLALAAFDDRAASAELHRMLDDRDLQVRQAAEELLAIESGEAT